MATGVPGVPAPTAGDGDISALLASVRDSLSALGEGNTLGALFVLVGVGTIAMAVLQVIKELTPLRLYFQCWWIGRWIDERREEFENALDDKEREALKEPALPNQNTVKAQLAELATGREKRALYDLPIEDLVTQADAAAQIALDEPSLYWALLAVLSEGTSRGDLKTLRDGAPSTGSTQPYFDARARIARRIQRNLDGVRIACGNRWKYIMFVASLILTTGIVEAAVAANTTDDRAWLLALPFGIVGGYLAPVARDLFAALQKLRNP
jgi:hypothetical protein